MKTFSSVRSGRTRRLWFVVVTAVTLLFKIAHGGTCTPPPAGLVGWWPAEGNANDIVGGDNAILTNITYTAGEVSSAFFLNGSNACVRVPADSNLNVGAGNGFTFETWINPASLNPQPVAEWNDGAGDIGTHFFISESQYPTLGWPPGGLYANVIDSAGEDHIITTGAGVVATNVYQHIALTYDKASGVAVLYCNGTPVQTANLGSFTPQTSFDLFLGERASGFGAGMFFNGTVDEPSLYNRALSAAEIQAIYNAGSAGKCQPISVACLPPPAGLAGWWPAEGDANDVIDGDNGALEGGATFAPGLVGQGFRFDGTNGYVQIPDSAELKPTNVTCEAWVRLDPNLPVNRGGEQIVFKKNTWSAWFEGYSLLKATIDNGNGTYSDRFQFCVSRYGNQVAINSQTIAQRGVWYHVAGTYDGNQSKLYVNGVLEASATPGFPLDYDTTPIFIGTSGTWAPYLSMFGGIIDEASIYGRALSTNEIQAIYNAGSAGKCTPNESTNNCVAPPSGLVGWWKGEGNIADNVNGDNGMVVSGTVTYAPAEVGQGFNFDGGANRITVPDAPQLNFGANQDFSIEAWIQPDVATTDYGVMSIVDKRIASGSTDSPNGYEFSVSNGRIDCRFGSVSFISAGPDLRDGLFHHVALTVSRNSTNGGKLYADGVVVLTFDPTPLNGSLINSEPLRIGNHADFSLNCFFKGIIDEVSLYNRALATNEIQAIYNAGSAGKCMSPQSGVPVISGFTPPIGASGTVVTISGANFSATASANIVYFGAVRANVLLASPTSLMVMAPTGATYAPITVTVNGMVAYSSTPFEPTFSGTGAAIDSTTFAAGFNLSTPNGPYRTAIADLDGDGRPDLVVIGGTVGMISIYQNIGTNGVLNAGTFAAPIQIPVGNNCSAAGLAVADVNGDGKLDLVVSDNINNQVAIFQNQFSGGLLATNSFAAPVYLPVGADPRQVAVRDLDGDGFPDIICVNVGAGTVSIFRNVGANGPVNTNSFAPRVDLTLAGNSESVAVGDLDGDGQPDLAVADSSGFISVFRNHCTPGNISAGTFDARVDLPAQSGSLNIVIGDLDGDGKPELIASAYLPQTMSVYRNLSVPGSLTINSFAAPVDYGLAGRGHNIALADFNGDGKPDIAEVTELASALSLFQNIGTGGFTNSSLAARVDFATGWNAWGIAVGDLDGDGRPDAVFANTYDNTITIYHNQMPLAVNPPSTNSPVITAIVPNIAVPGTVITISGTNFSPFAASNIVYFGAVQATVSSASFSTLVVTVPSGATYAPITVTVNGLTAYAPQPFEPIFPGAGQIDTSSLAPFVNLPTGNGPGQVVVADLDGDGKPDLIIPDSYAGEISIYQNISTNGSLTAGSFAPRVVLPLLPTSGTNPYRVIAADLDGDGRLDIVVLNPDSNVVSILRNVGSPGSLTTNSFAARIDLPGGNVMRGLAVQDLNGDGRPEIVTGNNGDNTISVFQNLSTVGNIAFAARVDFPAGNGASSVAIGDLDGDGQPDIAVANINDGTISVLRNTGMGGNISINSFAPKVDFPALATPFPIAIGDLDGDGKLDLVVGGSQSSQAISVYRNTSTAGSITTSSFAPHVDFSAPGWVNSLALADLDGDGRLDIALVSQLSSVFSIFKNVGQPGTFTTASLAARVDYPAGYNPNGLAIGDLDGDGRPDVVFANSYDNNIYVYHNLVQPATAPVVTMQPTNQNVAVGGTASFIVAVQGASPFNYQWSFNGTNLDGATNVSLTLSNVQLAQTGNYSVVISNLVGAAISSNALLTVFVPAIPPSILSQTPNQVVLLGNTATFSVNAGGSDPLSYFWQRNGAPIPGATNASYSLLSAQLSDSGSKFSCLVTNAYGSASSTNVSLKVIDTMANDLCSGAIIITNACYTNAQSTLKASSFGDPAPDCVDGFGHGVWYQFTAPVAGLLSVDTFGSDFDTGLAIYTGSCDGLTEVACDDDTDGVTSQVTIPTVAGMTYSILVGGYGSDAGNLILHLTHQTPPAFVIQPTNQDVVVGSNITLTAILAGTRPLSYQWLLDGNPLSDNAHYGGSTTPALTISDVTTADAAGMFSVTVTNILGSVTSAVANLNVLSITTQPVGRSVPPGLPTTFTAVASSSPAPAYQWQLNGTNIPGATSASYTIPAVGTNDLGLYHLLATYPVGIAASTDAQLTFGPVAAWGLNSSGECLPPPGLSNVMAVAGTSSASFAVRTDGTIIPWGSGSATNIPAGASNVVALATTGTAGNYALCSDGTVVGWAGLNPPVLSNIVSIAAGKGSSAGFGYALRAEGTLANWGVIPTPAFPTELNHLTAVACGYNNALALRNDGTVVASGAGAITNIPSGLNNVVAVAAGYTYAMALKANGTVVAWGSGSGTNLPAGMTNIVAISADNCVNSNFGLAIRADGRVLAWGDNVSSQINSPTALTNLVCIAGAAARYHGLALVNDGSPVILQPPIGLTAYTGRDVTLQAVAAGGAPLSYQWLLNGINIPGATNTSLFISNVQLGNAGNYQLFVSNRVNTALSLAAPLTVVSNSVLTFLSQPPVSQTNYQGSKAALGVTVLGSGPLRYQWSYSTNNQIFTAVAGATNDSLVFDPAFASQSGYYRVAVSNQFTFMTRSSTYLRVLFAKAWGYLAKDPPFDVTNAVAIAVGNAGQGAPLGHYLTLKSDGKISSWSGGFSPYGETNVAALSNSFVTAIAAGYQDSLALKSDGTVYAWGYSVYGETNVPPGLNGVTAIACGDYHDLALKSDGTVAGWGQNTYQQTTNAAATNVVAIAAGGQDSIALRADGSVVTWGSYGGGQYPLPFNITNIIAVAAGGQHYLALRANGTVVGWGNNPNGQTTIPAGISNVVAISAGANHSVLLRNDGTVVTLGVYAGQIAVNSTPADLANVVAIASSGDHDLALFGTRAPAFTVQPWNRAFPVNVTTNITLAAKCAGVQPMHYQWQLNGTNVPGATNDTMVLSNSLATGRMNSIQSGAYQLIASNAYGVAASKYAKITTFYPLADALDTPTDGKGNSLYTWTTSGNAQWFGETNITHDGVDAAQSGGISALQETILQTTVGTNWSGRYTFWWKVSSEQDFDFLEFRVNGITQTNISGQVDWQPVSIHVATGTNVLQWRYYKDVSFDFGMDAGWVDQFAFIPDPPLITLQPLGQTNWLGSTATFQANAIWRGIANVQWLKNGTNLPNAHSVVLTLMNLTRQDSGVYTLQVTNVDGKAVSSNAVLKVLVPQLLGSPLLLPDGSFQLTSTDVNGGLLQPSDLANFEAQTSTNLMDWVTLPGALSLTNGILLLQDTAQSNYPARFYRLLEH